ncbi:MAG: hypothetical protein Q9160_007408, partial [Pyrenula sp. 1 TL-2023]
PNAASRIEEALRSSSARARNDFDAHTATFRSLAAVGQSSTSSTPPSVHLRGTNSPNPILGTSQGVASSNNAPSVPIVKASTLGGASVTNAGSEKRFLLTCFDTALTSNLVQIDLTSIQNDEYMFNLIRNEYIGQEQRSTSLMSRVGLWMQKRTRVGNAWPFNASLTTVHGLEFVSFFLVPARETTKPWNFLSPSLPPEDEVRHQKYHYVPCPLGFKIASLEHAMLHSLLKPGPHLDSFWLNLFPKKLKAPLSYVPNSTLNSNLAWGIRIRRGLNWVILLWLLVLVVTTIGAGAVAYSILLQDPSGAFSIAGYTVTTVTLIVGYLQLKAMSPV